MYAESGPSPLAKHGTRLPKMVVTFGPEEMP